MLHHLMEYARSHGLITEPGFTAKTVAWAIDADDGATLQVNPLGDLEARRNRGQEFPRCPELTQPELIGGKEPRSHFLVESAEVVAMHAKGPQDSKKEDRVRGKRRWFLDTLRQADPAYPGLAAVADRLEDAETLKHVQAQMTTLKVKPTDKVTLRINGDFPVESDRWHTWWREFRAGLADPTRAESSQMVCFLTGQATEALRVQPKIVGLADVGGLPTGDALSAFDKDAFTSFGLSQGENAAVSETAFTACRSALNNLLAHSSHRFPGARVVYWFQHHVKRDNDPARLVYDPSSGEDDEDREQDEASARTSAKKLLDAVPAGLRASVGENRYYILTLSGCAGRVMVRDWEEGSFQTLQENTRAWFEDLSIAHRGGGGPAPAPKFLAVAGALARDLKDVPAHMFVSLWRCALRRAPIPTAALALAVRRVHLDIVNDRSFNHARMGLLKAYHIRQSQGESTMKPYMNPEHPETAYHCGRLLAVLADLQYQALGDVGAGVVQRYYGDASRSPGLALTRLIALSNHHLNKLKPGIASIYKDRIATVMSCLKDEIPATLDLQKQSLFALGYYQQIAADIDARRKGAAAKRAKAAEEENSNA